MGNLDMARIKHAYDHDGIVACTPGVVFLLPRPSLRYESYLSRFVKSTFFLSDTYYHLEHNRRTGEQYHREHVKRLNILILNVVMSTFIYVLNSFKAVQMYVVVSLLFMYVIFQGGDVATNVIKKVRTADGKREALRDTFWPNIEDEALWLRKKRTGFTTIPRTLNLVGRIMDQLSGKGFPLFSTYFTLWCRVYDEAFVEIKNDREVAFESGFSGGRGEVTWRTRMRKLKELGFIDIRPGLASDMQYVLMLNPIHAIVDFYKINKLEEDFAYKALMARLIEVGADDLTVRGLL